MDARLSSGTGLFDPTLDAAGTYTYSLNVVEEEQ